MEIAEADRVVECDLLGAAVDGAAGVVVDQVGTDSGDVLDNRDVELVQRGRRSNAREHEQLRAADGTSGDDDLLGGQGDELVAGGVVVGDRGGRVAVKVDL